MADTHRPIHFSSYPMTEDEYDRLSTLRDQLGLFNNLLSMRRVTSEDRLDITAAQLSSFTFALETIAIDLLKALDRRYEASREEDLPNWVDWSNMLEFLAGRSIYRYRNSRGRLREITRRLRNAATAEPDMRHVVDAWTTALTQGHADKLDAVLDSADADDELTPAALAIEAGTVDAARSTPLPDTPRTDALAADAGDTVALSEATIEQMLATACGQDESVEVALAVMEALSDGPHEQRRQRVLSAYMKALQVRGMALPELVCTLMQARSDAGRPAPAAVAAAHDEMVASVLAARARTRRTQKPVASTT